MAISDLPKVMLICLICTIILELIPSIIIGIRSKKDIFNIVLTNIITNPIVVFTSFIISLKFGHQVRVIYMIIIEIAVVLIEALIYKKTISDLKMNPLLFSIILNASSYFIGEVINNLIY